MQYVGFRESIERTLNPLKMDDFLVAIDFFRECGTLLIQVPKRYQVALVRRAIRMTLGEPDRVTEQCLFYNRHHIKIVYLEDKDAHRVTQGYARAHYIGYKNELELDEYERIDRPWR